MNAFRLATVACLLPALALAQVPAPSVPGTAKVAVPAGVLLKQPSAVDAKGFLGVIGQTVTAHATLRHRTTGAPVPGKALRFTIGGDPAGAALTDAAGVAKIPWKVPNKTPGDWPVEIRFGGDDEWLPSSAAVTMGVFKASTKVTVSGRSGVNVGESFFIGGDLTRTTDGARVEGRAVTMKVNGAVAGKPATDLNGHYSLQYKASAASVPAIHVEAQFDGDVLHAASAAAVDVPVKPPAMKAKLHPQNGAGRRGATVTLKALLVPQNPMVTVNGGAGGVKVKFTAVKPPSEPPIALCETTTLPDGRAECSAKFDLPETYYMLYAKAGDTGGDWEIEETFSQMSIQTSPTTLQAWGPAAARIGDTIHVKVRLTRATDNAPMSGRPVYLLNLPPVQTNTAGEAVITFAVPSGTVGARVLAATYPGLKDHYELSEGSLTIQVSPKVN